MLAKSDSLSENLMSQSQLDRLGVFQPIELRYTDLSVVAKDKKTTKTIIHNQSGVISPGTFTAILGPSGSGKTTLLNFLSGRLVANNLRTQGVYCINGEQIKSVEPYANQIAYIMQDDILIETMTPRESFMFSASMRLRLTRQQRQGRVRNLIDTLGLGDCCDTKIGNNLKKGISGGQRKRTSIGIQLITDPSVIFLDEPTTGLDSTTALQVVLLLRKLANQGRSVVSTIHQPSSQVFHQFDKLLLIVQGRCIYKGDWKQAQQHFSQIGYECPPLMNLAEFYMDMMSLQLQSKDVAINDDYFNKARQQHSQKIMKLEQAYVDSSIYTNDLNTDSKLAVLAKNNENFNVNGWKQFGLLFNRAFLNQIRNPMDVTLKITQAIFTALIVFVVFGRLNTTDKMTEEQFNIYTNILQNIKGVIFFLVSFTTFSGLQGTLATFSGQKPMFLRERFSRTYTTWNYFWARSIANLPFQLIYPTVPALIVFYGIGLNNNEPENFLVLLLIINVLYFCAASYGLFYSAVIPKLEIAMALVPVLIIPFMMLSGFFRDLDQVSKIFYPLEYLSPFRYGFQACMFNQFTGKPFRRQLEKDYIPDSLMLNLIVLGGLGLALRVVAFMMMYLISNPKRPEIHTPPPKEQAQ